MKYLIILFFIVTSVNAQFLLIQASGEELKPIFFSDPMEQMFGGTPTLGSDTLSGWDLTSGWTAYNGAVIVSADTFTTDGTSEGGIFKGNLVTIGATYLCSLDGSITGGIIELRYTASGLLIQSGFGSFIFTASQNGFIFRNNSASTNEITTFTIKEITNFTAPTDVTDYSGKGNTGTFAGSMEDNQPTADTSAVGTGWYFDGVDDYVSTSITTSSTSSTLLAWVKFADSEDNTTRYLFATTTGSLYKNTSNNLIASSGTIYIDDSTYVAGDGLVGWHFIALTGVDLTGTAINIGASITPADYFNGFMDKPRIYNKALTEAEILKIYNAEVGGH